MENLTLRVAEARMLNPLIRSFTLRADDGGALPGFAAGAHIRVHAELGDGLADWRHYSLIDAERGGADAPRAYRIAVRREDGGRGGSRWMHAGVQEGAALVIEPPRNDFPLREHAGAAVLVAGGIGVTPLVSMAARRRALGLPVRLFYAARDRGLMAFADELRALLGADLHAHLDAEAGAPLDVARIVAGLGADEHLYVCGPRALLDAALAQAAAHGVPRERVHFELFTAPVTTDADRVVEVVLAQSGRTLTVPAGTSILDALIDAGCDPLYDCKRGECGVCQVGVIDGEVDHRDAVLSDAEKASGKLMQVCVSRAKGARLVLDI